MIGRASGWSFNSHQYDWALNALIAGVLLQKITEDLKYCIVTADSITWIGPTGSLNQRQLMTV